ncbi:MAG: phosphopentomutase [candidate division Zixibacteria bacterium]|nr:phosphopentomutase [candidate division Zixibacteria bacterium]
MPEINRVILIVLDSCGVGELPDAEEYNDQGSNTIGNTASAVNGLFLPNLQELGLGNIIKIEGVSPEEYPLANYGKMAEKSIGKDSTTGHWEIAGLIVNKPFPTYPQGFPTEVMKEFEKTIQRQILGNKPASGTEIIKELGEEHLKTGKPICYTSADSVFQIACHENVIPPEELYGMCQKAREILSGKHGVARVIARPFVGKPGSFKRTERRKDFSLPPPGETILDILKKNSFQVVGIGKIEDLFAGRGLTESLHTENNLDGIAKLYQKMEERFSGLIFINLIDFDMLWGHRNDVVSFARGLEEFDLTLAEILGLLKSDDLLIITADHGCDPTTSSTDHSREYVPLLVYGEMLKQSVNLKTRETFSDIAQTLAEIFNVTGTGNGKSFLKEIYVR